MTPNVADTPHYRIVLANTRIPEPWQTNLTFAPPTNFDLGLVVGLVSLMLAILWLCLRQFAKAIQKRDRQIAQLTATDPMTGLANRLELCRAGTRKLQQASPTEPTILLHLDLDRFQLINDTLGHEIGDRVLCQVGRRLKIEIDPCSVVARISGDTFSLLLSGGPQRANEIAIQLLESLHQPFYVQGHTIHVSGSLGIALAGTATSGQAANGTKSEKLASPQSIDTQSTGTTASIAFGQMLNQADIAMSWAKAARADLPTDRLGQGGGKGGARSLYSAGKLRLQTQFGQSRYRFFEPRMQAEIRTRSRLQQDLKIALINRELRVHYQPIVDLATSRTVSFEALVRWQHPERGLMQPQAFLPTAESMGLIVAVDRWVLAAVCQQLAEWRRLGGQQPSISINLSGAHFSEPDLVREISQLLDRYDIPAGQLNLEITESIMIANPAQAIETVAGLKALGLRISLDDFGTGYSSLGYLHRLPVDVLKIDQSFVRCLGADGMTHRDRSTSHRPDSRLMGKCPEDAHQSAEAIAPIGYAGNRRKGDRRSNSSQKIGTSPRSDEVIVRTILVMAESLNLQVVAEGIERPDQLRLLKQMRCRYGQGHLFSEAVSAHQVQALIEQI